ncbi:MAG: hypothetical protein JW982_10795 [Spirochaetes bacterium]|nr:hypothetical protein [Spirochaetota bacterium]
MLFNKYLAASAAAILVSIYAAAAQNASALISKSSIEYKSTEISLISDGEVSLTNLQTVTRYEFTYLLQKSEAPDPETVTTDLNLKVMPSVIAFRTPYSEYDKFFPADLLYTVYDLPPFAEASAGMGLGNWFFISSNYYVKNSKGELTGPGFYSPASSGYYEAGEAPSEAYLSFAMKHASLSVGRFKTGIGEGFLGNTFLNGKAPWYDQMQFSIYTDKIKFFYMIGGSNSHLTEEEFNLQNQVGGIDNNYYPTEEYKAEHMKTFIYHRLEWKPFRNFKLGFGEMNVVGGKFPEFNELNPVTFYHNTYDVNHREYMCMLDLNYVPVRGLLIYSEFVINELKLSNERSAEPTALAQQLGIKYVFTASSGLKHSAAIEAAHVDSWTYIDYVPYTSMYQRIAGQTYYYDVPLGYAYGGDLIHYGLKYEVFAESGFSFSVEVNQLLKGEKRMGLDEETGKTYYDGTAGYRGFPTGTIERTSSVKTKLNIPFYTRYTFQTSVYYSYIENFLNEQGNDQHEIISYCGVGVEI